MRLDLGGCYLEIKLVDKRGRRLNGDYITPEKVKLLVAMLGRGIGSQRELARRIGVAPWTLTKHIRGYRHNPEVVAKIETFLNGPHELLDTAPRGRRERKKNGDIGRGREDADAL